MVSIPCKIGDFVCQFIPIQIKIVLQKVQFPPKKFKIKSFDDPRKTFENEKVLPVLLERGRLPLHDYRHCTFIFLYIIYSFNSLPKQCA